MSAADVEYRTSEPTKLHAVQRLREILRRREVLTNLSNKELKVKYKSTVLGVVWSMLNPLLYLLVFYLVFTFFLRSGIPNFAVYLLSGLLAFTLFSTGLQGSTASVVSNGSLVTKVAFPREILPISSVGASLVNFFYQFLVLLGFMAAFRYSFLGANLALLPLALVVLLLFTTALGMGTSALNVRYRDTQHLVDLALVAAFWFTPIVYSATLVLENVESEILTDIYLSNPLTVIVLGFQRALYGGTSGEALAQLPDGGLSWYAIRLGWVALGSLILLALTWRRFFRMSGDFAEEL